MEHRVFLYLPHKHLTSGILWSTGSSCTYPINILQVVYYGAQGLPVPTPINILQVVYYGAQGLPVPTPINILQVVYYGAQGLPVPTP